MDGIPKRREEGGWEGVGYRNSISPLQKMREREGSVGEERGQGEREGQDRHY